MLDVQASLNRRPHFSCGEFDFLCSLDKNCNLACAGTAQEEAFSDQAFVAILLLVVATGVLDGIAQGALYGQYALLPPSYTQVKSCALSQEHLRLDEKQALLKSDHH